MSGRLEELDVDDTKITDQGIADFRYLTRNLRRLHVQGTQITDSAMIHLARIRTLEYLDLRYTKVSEKAIHDIRMELPELNVIYRK